MEFRTKAKIGMIGLLCSGAVPATALAFSITPTYNDTAGQTWNSTEKQVVQAAINRWTSALTYLSPNQNIPMAFDFTTGKTYLGQWQGGISGPAGMSFFPYSTGVTHTVHINADDLSGANPLVFSLGSPASSDYDAYSVILHELGHALGFSTLYVDSNGGNSAQNKYQDHVTITGSSAVFDQGGAGHLNVQLNSSSDIVHLFDSSTGSAMFPSGGGPTGDLMSPAIANGVRRDISNTDLNMLSLAYGYTIVPEPASLTLLGIAAVGLLGRRRRGVAAPHNQRSTIPPPRSRFDAPGGSFMIDGGVEGRSRSYVGPIRLLRLQRADDRHVVRRITVGRLHGRSG